MDKSKCSHLLPLLFSDHDSLIAIFQSQRKANRLVVLRLWRADIESYVVHYYDSVTACYMDGYYTFSLQGALDEFCHRCRLELD